MKVSKFGGSSLANAIQIQKVGRIIQQDAQRKFIVVSAPGKRISNDVKITDLLIKLFNSYVKHQPLESDLQTILTRFSEIIDGLDLKDMSIVQIKETILHIFKSDKSNEAKLDCLKAVGEDTSAQIVSAYLRKLGLNAKYLNPADAGIFVSDEPGNAQILPESFANLYKLRSRSEILVIPGFFGYSKKGNLVTFSRGGSDITGSIVAAGTKASLYENFTDVDSVYTVNPTIVENPKEINTVTYKEMRELSYAGFSVFHAEALIPAFREKIPVAIKNTNNPNAKGTLIVANKEDKEKCVVGIASDSGFCSLFVSKYLMNRELGFGRKLFQILENEGVSFEHAPSGIDDMTVIIREKNLSSEKEAIILEKINDKLKPEEIKINRNLAMIMIVGERMMSTIGIAQRATTALSQAGVNIIMINQGASEVSMMFGIKAEDMDKAIKSLYRAFFIENPS